MLRSRGNPGRFDYPITIEQVTNTANSIGENEKTWTVYGYSYCTREWKLSKEKYEASELVSSDNGEFAVIYDANLNTSMRFKFSNDTSYFYILNIQQWKREGYSLITAIRRDNQ